MLLNANLYRMNLRQNGKHLKLTLQLKNKILPCFFGALRKGLILERMIWKRQFRLNVKTLHGSKTFVTGVPTFLANM